MYINYERAARRWETAPWAAFVYLLPEGFAMDYYTEIDVTLTGAMAASIRRPMTMPWRPWSSL